MVFADIFGYATLKVERWRTVPDDVEIRYRSGPGYCP